MINLNLAPQASCIFCGASEGTRTDEHITPRSLGGSLKLLEATCSACQSITAAFEGALAGQMYKQFREINGFPSYKKRKERPTAGHVELTTSDGAKETLEVPFAELPSVAAALHLPPPGVLTGAPLSAANPEMSVELLHRPENLALLRALLDRPDATDVEMSLTVVWGALCRSIAKAAHTYLVAAVGREGYEPLLPDLILGKYPYLSHLVGGYWKHEQTVPELHKSSYGFTMTIVEDQLVEVSVSMMGNILPPYQAVAAYIPDLAAFNVAMEVHDKKIAAKPQRNIEELNVQPVPHGPQERSGGLHPAASGEALAP